MDDAPVGDQTETNASKKESVLRIPLQTQTRARDCRIAIEHIYHDLYRQDVGTVDVSGVHACMHTWMRVDVPINIIVFENVFIVCKLMSSRMTGVNRLSLECAR